MPLDKAALTTAIKSLINSTKSKENQQSAIDEYAEGLADAIEAYVKSGDVITSGSPSSHTGKVT